MVAKRLTDDKIFRGKYMNFTEPRLSWNFDDDTLVDGLHIRLKVNNIIIYENIVKYIEDDII